MNNSQEIILAQISAIYDKPPFVKVKTGQMEMILKCVGLGKYYDEYAKYLEPYWYNRGFQNDIESYRIFVGLNSIFEDAGVKFKTYSGLPFTYEIKKGRNGEYTKELWIDRREKSKSLEWSSVLLALQNIKKVGEVVDRPKALGDIRGVTYIYGMFYRFRLIDLPVAGRSLHLCQRWVWQWNAGRKRRTRAGSSHQEHYQSSTVLDEPEREAGTTSIPIPQREESENIPLPDLPGQLENVQQSGNEIAKRGMPT